MDQKHVIFILTIIVASTGAAYYFAPGLISNSQPETEIELLSDPVAGEIAEPNITSVEQ